MNSNFFILLFSIIGLITVCYWIYGDNGANHYSYHYNKKIVGISFTENRIFLWNIFSKGKWKYNWDEGCFTNVRYYVDVKIDSKNKKTIEVSREIYEKSEEKFLKDKYPLF